MAVVLLIVYLLIFILQIVLFVMSLRGKTKKLWMRLFFTELIPLCTASGLAFYYENLPGYGLMPGLSYLGEALFSFGAAVLYGTFFLVSVCACIVCMRRK